MPVTPRFGPRRPLGRTGFVATSVGQGDVADRAVPKERCVAVVRRALDAGVNLVDTAPMYEQGYSEEIVGEALRGRREGVLLVDKVDDLAAPVAPQLDASLGRLGTGSIDLVLFHAVPDVATWRRLAAPGGAFEELGEEVARGRARFRGVSSHHPDVLAEAVDSGLCDAIMLPVGPIGDPRFTAEILPRARARGVGTLGMKVFGGGKLLGDTEGYQRPLSQRPRGKLSSGGADGAEGVLPRLSVEACLRYTLTIDPDVALLGLSFENEQDAAFAAAERAVPMSADELRELRHRALDAARGKGAVWWDPTGAATRLLERRP
jgi:aryl-alcohol dehydrogenase-like predicted oxidoreductase